MRSVIADQGISAKAREYLDLQKALDGDGVFDKVKRFESLKRELSLYLDQKESAKEYSVQFSTGVWADLRISFRKAVDATYFKTAYPEVYDACLKESRVRSLTVSEAQND